MKHNLFVLGLRYALIAALMIICSCKKTTLISQTEAEHGLFLKQSTVPVAPLGMVDVSLDIASSTIGANVPANFVGLSYEKSDLINPTWPYFNQNQSVFLQLIKNLKTGVLRLGGNSADKIFWQDSLRGSSTSIINVYRDDVTRFKLFMDALGADWKLIYGLNLANDTVHTSEVNFVQTQFGTKVLSFEIGNEPDLYPQNGYRATGYGIVHYKPEFEASYNILHAGVPTAPFSGPTVSSKTAWIQTFASDEASRINFLTTHYYKMGAAGTIAQLMQYDSTLVSRSGIIAAASASSGLPYRYAECNSVNNGGKDGVSNVFASALWGVDLMFYLARKGAMGVDFHGGRRSYYAPIYYNANNTFGVKPLYYGLLMFALADMKQSLNQLLNKNGLNITAYAFKNSAGKTCALVVNKDASNTALLTITNASTIVSAKLHELVTSAATPLSATTGITLDGAAVNATNGTWNGTSTTTVAGTGTSEITLTINPARAVLIELN
jgi:hypothetical protein